MIARRDVLIGGSCMVAAGAALALRPREHMSLVGSTKLDEVIPRQFGGWHDQETNALVVPLNDDGLAAKLYSQIVGRLYVNPDVGSVMMLIAYGDTQNDLLQLHRPETCYPAFGFQLTDNRTAAIALSPTVSIPGRALTATTSARTEHILYWTRIGETLPENGREQRIAKLRSQFAGVVPDGVLVRLSNNLRDDREAFSLNQGFAAALMTAIPPRYRASLIGTREARKLA